MNAINLVSLNVKMACSHPRPFPFNLERLPKWIEALTDRAAGFNVAASAVTAKIQDVAFGYHVGLDLFGYGKVEMNAETSSVECRGARSAPDLAIIEQTMSQFLSILDKLGLSADGARFDLVANGYFTPGGSAKEWLRQFAPTFLPVSIHNGISVEAPLESGTLVHVQMERAFANDLQVSIHIQVREKDRDEFNRLLTSNFPADLFTVLKCLNVEVKIPPYEA